MKLLPTTRACQSMSFTESDEEAGTRGPCQSAMHSAMTRSASGA